MHAMMFPIWTSGPILFETSQPCGSSEHGFLNVVKLAQTIIAGIYGSIATIIGDVTIHQGRKAWEMWFEYRHNQQFPAPGICAQVDPCLYNR